MWLSYNLSVTVVADGKNLGYLDLDHYFNVPDYCNGPRCFITGARIIHVFREMV